MCSPIKLKHNQYGYISWCNDCNNINIAFHTILFSLNTSQFENFSSILSNDVNNTEKCNQNIEKSFLYNTDSLNVNIILNYIELVQLAELVADSFLQYRSLQLIKEISQNI